MTTLDSHVHLWNRQTDPQPWIDPATMGAIDRDYGPADLAGMLAATGMAAAVVVQSSNSFAETRRLLGHSAPAIAGVVGWIDLTTDPAAQLAGLDAGADRRLVGIRHLVHLDPDPEWLSRPAVRAGVAQLAERDLSFDLVVRAGQLPMAAALADACPAVRFVVDHLGGIADTPDERTWAADLRELSARRNVWAKLSGLAGLVGRDSDRLRRTVDVALEAFGPDRLMYGSDWPVAQLGAGAAAWRSAVHLLLAGLSPADRTAILGGTGSAFYRLGRS
ncbi:amidohydrolase [Actinoplanes sp. N902-109]|uniref:amidohydrolase family protein n=1 Tax=Actinoplanes sp. (strain N902-109) TaxID=649831 RepID=UPI0003293DC2|nr:amidohydrolase family protein [Actinoplanes sp. N902-109]AGL19173.1 amidohydrolase [Actinoplanes sp. N902-109]